MLIEIEYKSGKKGIIRTDNIFRVWSSTDDDLEIYYNVEYTDEQGIFLISEEGYKTLCEAIEKEQQGPRQQLEYKERELLRVAKEIRQQLTEINNELKRINGYADRRD